VVRASLCPMVRVSLYANACARTHAHTHTNTHKTHTHTPNLPHACPLSRTCARTFSLSLSHTHTLAGIYTNALAHTHAHMANTHTHTAVSLKNDPHGILSIFRSSKPSPLHSPSHPAPAGPPVVVATQIPADRDQRVRHTRTNLPRMITSTQTHIYTKRDMHKTYICAVSAVYLCACVRVRVHACAAS